MSDSIKNKIKYFNSLNNNSLNNNLTERNNIKKNTINKDKVKEKVNYWNKYKTKTIVAFGRHQTNKIVRNNSELSQNIQETSENCHNNILQSINNDKINDYNQEINNNEKVNNINLQIKDNPKINENNNEIKNNKRINTIIKFNISNKSKKKINLQHYHNYI